MTNFLYLLCVCVCSPVVSHEIRLDTQESFGSYRWIVLMLNNICTCAHDLHKLLHTIYIAKIEDSSTWCNLGFTYFSHWLYVCLGFLLRVRTSLDGLILKSHGMALNTLSLNWVNSKSRLANTQFLMWKWFFGTVNVPLLFPLLAEGKQWQKQSIKWSKHSICGEAICTTVCQM